MDGRWLGGELARLARPYLPTPDGVAITQADYRWLSLGPRIRARSWPGRGSRGGPRAAG